jgi:uncharacterized delta-60 repeat protein
LEALEDRTLLTAGDLDPTFGIGGKVVTDFFGPVDASASRVAIQGDGKIVVTGHLSNVELSFVITRYEVNGALDNSFGSEGKVLTDLGSGRGGAIASLAIQTDGKIVIASEMEGPDPFFVSLVVERFQSNGSLDRGFGLAGKVTTDFGGRSAPSAVAVQSDGRIVVVGSITTQGDFFAVRYNSDGSLDNSFGTAGKVITKIADFDTPVGVAIQGDGKVVVGGSASLQGGNRLSALIRYDVSGNLDASFGTGGKVTASFGGDMGQAEGMALQPDGRIVLVGEGNLSAGSLTMILQRINTDGSVDSSFGTGGQVSTQFGTGTVDRGQAVVVQGDGKIVAAGTTSSRNATSTSTALARYDSSGNLDPGFGINGRVTTSFGGGNDVTFQNDGKQRAA